MLKAKFKKKDSFTVIFLLYAQIQILLVLYAKKPMQSPFYYLFTYVMNFPGRPVTGLSLECMTARIQLVVKVSEPTINQAYAI